jgi:hypothetical protein
MSYKKKQAVPTKYAIFTLNSYFPITSMPAEMLEDLEIILHSVCHS